MADTAYQCGSPAIRGYRNAAAELKNWKILRKIRSRPNRATTLVKAVQTLIIAS